MPGAQQYVLDANSSEAREIDEAHEGEARARQAGIRQNWAYYDGDHRRHLKRDGTGTDDNLTINLIELLVDKSVSALMGSDERGRIQGIAFELPGEQGGGGGVLGRAVRVAHAVRGVVAGDPPRPMSDYLQAVWAANRKDVLLHNIAVNAAISGHAFVQIEPGGVPAPQTGAPLPRLVNLNPLNVSVFWDETDVERVLWYRVQAGAEGRRKRQDIVWNGALPGADGSERAWTVFEYAESGEWSGWKLTGQTDWPYPWPPVVDWQNLPRPNRYYGKDDVGTTGPLNDGLNFVVSNIQRILKHHAHPKTIGTGMAANDVEETAVDRFWAVPNEAARIFNLEMQSDLGSSLAFGQFIRRALFDSGRELDPASVQDRLGDLTNFGLRVLFRDTLAKGGTKRLLFADGLVRLCQHALELGGMPPRVPVTVVWPDPLPVDPLETARALQLDVEVGGLSQASYLERRGFDPAAEAERAGNGTRTNTD